jgi:anti-anti-sigma factor
MPRNESQQPLELLIVDGVPTVRGDLDLATASVLRSWLMHLNGQAAAIDLSGVTFFGSVALRSFLAARRTNANLRIVQPSAVVRRVLELTDTVEYLTGSPAARDKEEPDGASA